jgi:hypothetical protein
VDKPILDRAQAGLHRSAIGPAGTTCRFAIEHQVIPLRGGANGVSRGTKTPGSQWTTHVSAAFTRCRHIVSLASVWHRQRCWPKPTALPCRRVASSVITTLQREMSASAMMPRFEPMMSG